MKLLVLLVCLLLVGCSPATQCIATPANATVCKETCRASAGNAEYEWETWTNGTCVCAIRT